MIACNPLEGKFPSLPDRSLRLPAALPYKRLKRQRAKRVIPSATLFIGSIVPPSIRHRSAVLPISTLQKKVIAGSCLPLLIANLDELLTIVMF